MIIMKPSEIAKQSLHLSKVTLNNTFNAMLLLQEHVQRMIDIYLHQMLVFPEEGKRVADTWMKAFSTNREELKKVVEKKCEVFASFFPATAPCGPSSPWPPVSEDTPGRSDRPLPSLRDAKRKTKN
jgi:hypothetical protein